MLLPLVKPIVQIVVAVLVEFLVEFEVVFGFLSELLLCFLPSLGDLLERCAVASLED